MSHTVPRNMNKVEKLWKGFPDRFVYVTMAFWFVITVIAANALGKDWGTGLLYFGIAFILASVWFVFFRSVKKLDWCIKLIKYYTRRTTGEDHIYKFVDNATKVFSVLKVQTFLPDGTISFNRGWGWLYAFDPNNVTKDNQVIFNAKCQALINSLPDDLIFKVFIRTEPRKANQELTLFTNSRLSQEKDSNKKAHLNSVFEYAQEKETHDYIRRWYFFIGLINLSYEDAIVRKEKIEDGFKDKVNSLDIIFSQVKNKYLLFEYYRRELA